MSFTGETDQSQGFNQVVNNGEAVNANYYRAGWIPLGGTFGWDKTDHAKSSGTANSDVTNKLVDTTATFITDGVVAGNIVENTAAHTFAVVSSVDSETTITLKADARAGSSTVDIFPNGNETYAVYITMELADSFAEMNGQTISDASSPYNGVTLEDRNNATKKILRGDIRSGDTGGADTHTHTVSAQSWTAATEGVQANRLLVCVSALPSGTDTTKIDKTSSSASSLPAYVGTVWVKRIK